MERSDRGEESLNVSCVLQKCTDAHLLDENAKQCASCDHSVSGPPPTERLTQASEPNGVYTVFFYRVNDEGSQTSVVIDS
jgi:hypothetical protein